MLLAYAKDHGFPSPAHFTDDGISGTRFDRPDFEKELTEEEPEEIKQTEKRREKQRRAYLKRKESGWQARYDKKEVYRGSCLRYNKKDSNNQGSRKF